LNKKLRIKPGIPLYGLPLKQGNNPFIVIPFGDPIEIELAITKCDKEEINTCIMVPNINANLKYDLEEAYNKTFSHIAKFLDTKIKLKIRVKSSIPYPPIYLYENTIPPLLRIVFTIIGLPLSKNDVLILLKEHDPLNTPEEIVGLRRSIRVFSLTRKPIIYRYGEGYIPLSIGNNVLKRISETIYITFLKNYKIKYIDNPLTNFFIHLHGKLIIEAANALREGDIEKAKMLYKNETLLNLCLVEIEPKIELTLTKISKIVPDYNGITLITFN